MDPTHSCITLSAIFSIWQDSASHRHNSLSLMFTEARSMIINWLPGSFWKGVSRQLFYILLMCIKLMEKQNTNNNPECWLIHYTSGFKAGIKDFFSNHNEHNKLILLRECCNCNVFIFIYAWCPSPKPPYQLPLTVYNPICLMEGGKTNTAIKHICIAWKHQHQQIFYLNYLPLFTLYFL